MTVLNCFLEAVIMFGLPSRRIRCDKGGENSLISWLILQEVWDGEAASQERACTIKELKDCGEMYIVDVFATFLHACTS